MFIFVVLCINHKKVFFFVILSLIKVKSSLLKHMMVLVIDMSMVWPLQNESLEWVIISILLWQICDPFKGFGTSVMNHKFYLVLTNMRLSGYSLIFGFISP